MSYDLNVYGESALSVRALRRLMERDGELKAVVDKVAGRVTGGIDRRSRSQLLTIDGPFALEREDVSDEPQVLAGARVLYAVSAVSLSAEDLARVIGFANRLALESDGMVVDLQDYEPKGAHSESASPDAGRKQYLHVAWYRRSDGNADLAKIYLDAARAFFPLGVPDRFGTHEPFQGRLSRDGERAFDDLYRSECGLSDLLMKGRGIEDARISGWSGDFGERFHSIRLSFPLEKAVARNAIDGFEEFFTVVARKSSSFFGFAEVNTSRLRTAVSPHYRGAWAGLPDSAQWMTWFEPEYAELARPYLSSGIVTEYPEGIVHRWTTPPAGLAVLRPLLRRNPWVPAELLSRRDPGSGDVVEPARFMPDSLRSPAPGSAEAKRIERNIAANLEGLAKAD